MKEFNNTKIIGIDHGYGNMKTANCCFPTGVMKSDTEPTFVSDLLLWNDKYYSIGVGHKEFTADKFTDEDYYVLTLAAIARELKRERITEANVFIAAGLPLTWVSEQKAGFKKYLLQHNKAYEFLQNAELSYSKAVISAICGYMELSEENATEDAFLERVIQTIREETAKINLLGGLLQFVQQHVAQITPAEKEKSTENEEAVLDFLDSF